MSGRGHGITVFGMTKDELKAWFRRQRAERRRYKALQNAARQAENDAVIANLNDRLRKRT